jgi:Cu2+-containing amine oxidase
MNKVMEKIWFTGRMKTNQFMCPQLKPGDQLWGIYFTDREYARLTGDPLLGVVAAATKTAAEEAAVRQGLPDAWASPLTPEQIKSIREPATREQPRVTAPTPSELRTAIEVLKMLDQRLHDHVDHSVMQLPETELGDQYAAHLNGQTIEQTGHIEKVSTQLQNWREELLQQQNQQVAQSV